MAAVETIYDRFRVRGGTAAALASRNEVPLDRELIVERDTLKMKMGDGVTAYNSLSYLTADAEIAMRVDSDMLQYSTDGEVSWTDLFDLSDLDGEDGPPPEMRVSGGYIQWRAVGDPVWANLIALADLKGDDGDAGDAGPPGPSSTTFPTFSFDGGLGDIEVGKYVDLPIPFGFEILEWVLTAGSVGVLEVDLRVVPYVSHPPDSLDSICGAARPRLISQNKNRDDDMTDWAPEVPADSVIRAHVTACLNIKSATLLLRGVRS